MISVRKPAVAGQFYSKKTDELVTEIKSHLSFETQKMDALGVVSPHAGYRYSGDVAGSVYSKIHIPETVIIIGPNHTGLGKRMAIEAQGAWSTPLGLVEVDKILSKKILEFYPEIQEDPLAHKEEHSLETQLPFLQYHKNQFKIVPICLMRLNYEECENIKNAIFKAIKILKRRVLIIASSDLTHFESHGSAKEKDYKAINKVLDLDPKGLLEIVRVNQISMCGVVPVTVMLMCCLEMGATHTQLANYMTSGDACGDMDNVVGYAGIVIS